MAQAVNIPKKLTDRWYLSKTCPTDIVLWYLDSSLGRAGTCQYLACL